MIPDILSPAFINSYKDKVAPFGFNGMGYFVYKRTYSRILEGGGSEEWYQTVGRCINGAQRVGAEYTEEEAKRLFDHIFNLRCNYAGRMLWQLGTPTVEKYFGNSLLNCFQYNTKVLTRDGWKAIGDLVGKTVEVVTAYGKFVEAPIKSFGQQHIDRVTFSNPHGSKRWEVLATPGHRWLLLNKGNTDRTETTTEGLRVGDKVPVVRAKTMCQYLSPQGIQHGLIVGDGSCNGYESFIDLIDNTYDECKQYFILNRVSWTNPENPRHVRYGGFPNAWKQLPSIRENKSYLMGFLAGWIAADGSINKANGSMRLFSAKKDQLLFAKDVAAVCGFRTGDPYLERDENPFSGEPSELWSISFNLNDNPEILLIRSDHRSKLEEPSERYENYAKVVSVEKTDLFEEVYCAQVPDTHSFVIEGNILTGNCWFCSINEPKAFLFLFENLMLGGGVGFSIRREDVHELPRIKAGVKIEHQGTKDADFIVPDSRAGWVKLLGKVLDAYYVTGKSFTYSTILVRGAGEPIKGFGGTASGPKILIEGMQKIAKIMVSREEKKLRSVDALDICNIIGSIVVAGNVRRSAEIALGDPDDYLYLRAKNWSLGNVPNWRAMSNNTIYADSYDHISDEIWSNGYMIDSKTGYAKGEPYGFFNLPLSQRYGRLKDGLLKDSSLYPVDKDNLNGANPCGEIGLASYECCNLSELYLNNIPTKDVLIDCAKLLYKTQKAICAMSFLHKETEEIVHKNMRLGLGVTGICQSFDKIDWLDDCYVELRRFDKEWSKKRGLPASIKLTTVKPSGSLSLLAGATPGIHPAYSQFYIRRVRVGSNDKLVEVCRRHGYPVEYVKNFDNSENRDTVVVSFPCKTPKGAVLAKDMSVTKQLDMVAKLQSIWSDNAVSVTAYYDMEELPVLKDWLKDNYEKSVKSVSFLLRDKHGFQQAPYQEITEDQYNEMLAKIKLLDSVDDDVGNGVLTELECAGGACPVR
jgi:ribonucleotide reductase alpha subunit